MWHAVGEALYRIRRTDRLLGRSSIAMIKDFAANEQAAADAVRLLGYRTVETEPDRVLTIQPHWTSFDDCLGDMTSGYRSAAKKPLKYYATAGITFRMTTADELVDRQDDIHALYEQVHSAQGLRLAVLEPHYLPAMALALVPRFTCRVAERDGQWLGFVISVDDGATAVANYVRYDLEPKAKMGAQAEPIAGAIRRRVSALNRIFSAFTRTASHDEPPERHPFKTKKETAPMA